METIALGKPALPDPTLSAKRDEKLWELSQSLEANFLSEMLKTAGLGKARDTFGGGAGEDHFSGFLVREYAEAAVRSGGIGLSEAIYRSLAAQEGPAK